MLMEQHAHGTTCSWKTFGNSAIAKEFETMFFFLRTSLLLSKC